MLVILKDGSFYIGTLTDINKQVLTLSGVKANQKIPHSVLESGDKAYISGLLGGLSDEGQGGSYEELSDGEVNQANDNGGGGGGGGFLGMLGMIGQMMPHIQVGMNVVKTIMPLVSLFKI